jgi:hypothetical protein
VRFLAKRHRWQRLLAYVAAFVLVGFVLIQVVPYGHSHSNPPVTKEPRWDSPRTRELAARACFDCHSNLTKWRWYSNIAPMSWLIQRDVAGGRGQFNFSEWDKPQDINIGDLTEAIRNGSMPPWFYTLPHPSANLTSREENALIDGLVATLKSSPPRAGTGG